VRNKVKLLGMQSLRLCTIALIAAIGFAMTGCPTSSGDGPQPLLGNLGIEVLVGDDLVPGAILLADTSQLSPNTGNFNFQWNRGTGAGATPIGWGSTYAVLPADVGHAISLTVTLAGHTGERVAQIGPVELVGTPGAFVFEPLPGGGYVVVGFHPAVTGAVIIPPVHNGQPVVGIGAGAFQNNTSITSIIIPPSVTFIGNNAFNSTSISSVVFAGTSQLAAIGSNAFMWSTNIGSLTIPASVTSVGSGAFQGWSSSQTIYLPFAPSVADETWGSAWRSGSNASIEEEVVTAPDPGPGPGAFTLSGQVWTVDWNNWPNVWQHFADPDPRIVSSWIGGSGAIVNGQLHFTIGAPPSYVLDNITNVFDFWGGGGGGPGDVPRSGNGGWDREDVPVPPASVSLQASEASGRSASRARGRSQREAAPAPLSAEGYWSNIRFSNHNAMFAILELETDDRGRWGELHRWFETETHTSFTYRTVTYLFVDEAVTITGTGRTIQYSCTCSACDCARWDGACFCPGTFRANNLNLALRAGWNPVLVTITGSFTGGSWSETISVSISDPADLRWELWEQPAPCRCVANECGGSWCGSGCQCTHIPSGATAITVTGLPAQYFGTTQSVRLFDSADNEVATGSAWAHSGMPWLTFVLNQAGASWDWFTPQGTYYARLTLRDSHHWVDLFYYSISAKNLTVGNNPVAFTSFERRDPTLTGSISISGTAQVGNWLSRTFSGFNTGTWNLVTQWQRGNYTDGFQPIENETSSSYTLQLADVGHMIRAVATSMGFSGYVASPAVGPVPPPPTLTGTISISGTAQAGNSLSRSFSGFNASTWDLVTQWERGNEIDGFEPIANATGANFTVRIEDIGYSIRVVATSLAFSGHVASNPTAPIPPLPYLTGTVTISGTPRVGNTLTRGVSGSNAGSGTWITRWERGNETDGFEPIANATGTSYTLGAGDVGYSIRAVVTSNFFAGYIASIATDIVTPRELTIDFDVPIATDIPGPTIRLGDGPGDPPRITVLNPGQFDGNVTWRMGAGSTLGQPGSVPWQAITGNHGETLILGTNVHNNRVGTHRVTVEVTKGGVLHSRVIAFYVEL